MFFRHLSYKNCHHPGEVVHRIRLQENTAVLKTIAELGESKARMLTDEGLLFLGTSVCKHRRKEGRRQMSFMPPAFSETSKKFTVPSSTRLQNVRPGDLKATLLSLAENCFE